MQLMSPTPWPAPPVESEGPAARMAWYGAVARWAPSKHNSQPWHFVASDTSLEVWSDPTRVLHETDPHRREMIMSCGAALATAEVAMRSLGFQPAVTLLPKGGLALVARLTEQADHDVTELDRDLLAAVAVRRTDRGPLDGDALPGSEAFLLQSAAAVAGATLQLVRSPGDRATLASLVERADRLLVQRRRVDEEIKNWLREPADPRPDGVPTDHSRGAAASYRAEFVQRDFSSATSSPAQDRPGSDRPLLGVLCTTTDRPLDWVRAGQALAGVLLHTARAGGNASYLNQPVEDPGIRGQLQEHLCLPGFPQAVLRIGIGGPVDPTPRRAPEDVVERAHR